MKRIFLIAVFLIGLGLSSGLRADSQYDPNDADSDLVQASPNRAWNDIENRTEDTPSVASKILLWLPNRIVDFLDIFRVDVGLGTGYGGVVRLTPHAQFAYRKLEPGSVRAGLFGRDLPIRFESGVELGYPTDFRSSVGRSPTPGEFGIGLDLLVGAYAGVCVDELFDFAGGLVGFDPQNDDF